MRVGSRATTDFLWTDIVCPHIGIRQEETLCWRETVNNFVFLRFFCLKVCSVGNSQTALVGDILAKSQLAIGMERIDDHNLVKLSLQFVCKRVKHFCIVLSPPVFHISIFVKLTSVVVKSMSHLMSDYNADCTIIVAVESVRREERSLKDTCREADFIGRRIVICIYCLRSHTPLCLVDRLATFLIRVLHMEDACRLHIFPI